MLIYVFVFIGSVFISSISQIVLKSSARDSFDNKLREYLNIKVILAYGLFFISSLLTILAYKGVPLSMGPVLESTGYIWVAILGRIILKEKINRKKIIGLICIIVGVLIFSLY